MALNNTYASITDEMKGDLVMYGGQLGKVHEENLGANADLWDIEPQCSFYRINPTVGGLSVELPLVSDVAQSAEPVTGVIHGHIIEISNLSSTNSLAVNNSAAALVHTVATETTVRLQATDNIGSGWRVIDVTQATLPGAVTMQDAYNNSGAVDPKIQLTNAFGAVQIRDDAAATLTEVFTVESSAGGNKFLTTGNNVPALAPYMNLLGGDASAGGASLAVNSGASTSAVGAVTVGDGLITADNSKSRTMLSAFTNGFTRTNGGIREGTTLSDAHVTELFAKALNVAVMADTTVAIRTDLPFSTSGRYTFEVIGHDVDDTSNGTIAFSCEVVVYSTDVAHSFKVVHHKVSKLPNGGGGSLNFTIVGNTLNAVLRASNNITGGNGGMMNMNIYCYYIAVTV